MKLLSRFVMVFLILNPLANANFSSEAVDGGNESSKAYSPKTDETLAQDSVKVTVTLLEQFASKDPKTNQVHRGCRCQGEATIYSDKFNGRKTTSGEVFSQNKVTAASNCLPMKSTVKVCNVSTKQCIEVRVNDTGGFGGKTIIDLSKASAKGIGLTWDKGRTAVRIGDCVQ